MSICFDDDCLTVYITFFCKHFWAVKSADIDFFSGLEEQVLRSSCMSHFQHAEPIHVISLVVLALKIYYTWLVALKRVIEI